MNCNLSNCLSRDGQVNSTVWPCHSVLNNVCSKFWNWEMWVFKLCFPFQYWGYSETFKFLINFMVILSISVKNPDRISIGKALNVSVNLGTIAITIILSLPVHEYGLSHHLGRSYLIFSKMFCGFQCTSLHFICLIYS